MFEQPTRGAHRAPRQQRRWFKRTRPACGPIPPVPVAEEPVLPSMDLPDGSLLRQRPRDRVVLAVTDTGSARIGHWLPAAFAAQPRDVVEVIDASSPHFERVGTVDAVSGTVRPAVVEIPGVGTAYFEHAQLGLVQRPAADTLVADALAELDDLPLMGGASR
jgi:hypothetical protein